jgi:hypothetical protein
VTQLYPAFVAGWLICVALLVIFHLVWRHAHRTVRYLLGAGAICTGCSVAGAIADSALLAFGPWIIASAGLSIALMTWLEEQSKTAKQNAQKNGEVIATAKGLKHELLNDRGHDAQSDMEQTRSRN